MWRTPRPSSKERCTRRCLYDCTWGVARHPACDSARPSRCTRKRTAAAVAECYEWFPFVTTCCICLRDRSFLSQCFADGKGPTQCSAMKLRIGGPLPLRPAATFLQPAILRHADVYSRIAVAATSDALSASSLSHASFFFRLRSLAASRFRSVRSIRWGQHLSWALRGWGVGTTQH